jgi:dTDP-4-dehydrorhamnose reductase
MKTILVTGANGQLGQCLQELSVSHSLMQFVFLNSKELDVTSKESVNIVFNNNDFDFCINCAAYTAVDIAESEQAIAEKVNVLGVRYLAEACKTYGVKLIHISTDFVFDGNSNIPYIENQATAPVSVYGKTKLEGENAIQAVLEKFFVLRTSWLYSEYGNNFVKTMLRLSKERTELGVISDQIGSPTYAKDLARVILKIIETDTTKYGVYHYSNQGVASWYDFAKAIFEISNTDITVNAIPTSSYPTPAKRPNYSVLNTSKLKSNLKVQIPYWRDSLKEVLKML